MNRSRMLQGVLYKESEYGLIIKNDPSKWTNAGHDNAVFLLDHSSVPVEFWDNVSADGGNIRVYFWDGTTETAVAREVVDVDTVGESGEIHFDSSDSSASTANEWRVYTESGATEPLATDPLGRNAVWTNYIKVDHAGGGTDSSGNANIGTAQGSVVSGDSVGKIGDATDYNEVDGDYFRYSAPLLTGTNDWTISAWIDINNNSLTNTAIFSQNTTDNSGTGRIYCYNSSSVVGDAVRLFIEGGIVAGTTDYRGAGSTRIDFRRSGNNFSLLENGVSVDTATSSVSLTGTDVASVGARLDIDGSLLDTANGLVDEFRIYNGALSDAYLETEYNNQSDPATFWTVEVK